MAKLRSWPLRSSPKSDRKYRASNDPGEAERLRLDLSVDALHRAKCVGVYLRCAKLRCL